MRSANVLLSVVLIVGAGCAPVGGYQRLHPIPHVHQPIRERCEARAEEHAKERASAIVGTNVFTFWTGMGLAPNYEALYVNALLPCLQEHGVPVSRWHRYQAPETVTAADREACAVLAHNHAMQASAFSWVRSEWNERQAMYAREMKRCLSERGYAVE